MVEKQDLSNVDYGPLTGLIGTWYGDKGLDVAPDVNGEERNPYHEIIAFEAIGTVTNADTQQLAVLRYQQIVRRHANGEVFHDQTGYWMWDAGAGMVMHTIVIPRAVCVLAGGVWAGTPGENVEVQVAARAGDPNWDIVQSPFMRENARTVAFDYRFRLSGGELSYSETTQLEIYGKTFEHTDGNSLTRY